MKALRAFFGWFALIAFMASMVWGISAAVLRCLSWWWQG